MSNETIDYEQLVDEAMRDIIKKALKKVETLGYLPEDQHFYITFATNHPGSMVPDELLAKYPQEMTIVMQHQFWDLEVHEEYFSVVLSFDNVHHGLTVPYKSLIGFADPTVRFGLQFKRFDDANNKKAKSSKSSGKSGSKKKSKQGSEEAGDSSNSNIVSLDSFRKH